MENSSAFRDYHEAFMNYLKSAYSKFYGRGDSFSTELTRLIDSLQRAYEENNIADYKSLYTTLSNHQPDDGFLALQDQLLTNSLNEQAHDWQVEDRDNSILSTADQLSQLGLSPAGALQIGSASAGTSLANSSNAMQKYSMLNKRQQFESRMIMTKQLLQMVSGMASSGIGGAAYGLARGALAGVASRTAQDAIDADYEMERQQASRQLHKDELLSQLNDPLDNEAKKAVIEMDHIFGGSDWSW